VLGTELEAQVPVDAASLRVRGGGDRDGSLLDVPAQHDPTGPDAVGAGVLLQLCVTMPCSAWNCRCGRCPNQGCISIRCTAGVVPVASFRWVRWAEVKLETPVERTRPSSRTSITARQVST
jgi:hypothetical protein